MRRTSSASNLLRPLDASDDFAARLERHIERTACGRVSGLRVALNGDAVVLQGRCRTYHAKQLVLQAALDMADGVRALVNQIVVD